MLVATIVKIVKSRMEVSASPEELANSLSAALARYEIPKDQFDEIEKTL
jgi:hypothetical protein